jgi:hypothetical protein
MFELTRKLFANEILLQTNINSSLSQTHEKQTRARIPVFRS